VNSLLDIRTLVPPLLEQQLSAPYKIVSHYLNHLQKWREYLLSDLYKGVSDDSERLMIQNSIDELISVILLIDFVRRLCPTSIPSLEEILKRISMPTAFCICEEIRSRVSCEFLKTIFDSGPEIKLRNNFDLSSLSNISKAVENLYSSRLLSITLFGDFHQLCLNRPISDVKAEKVSNRRNKGVYYTPAPLVDYIIMNSFEKVFYKLEPDQIGHLRIIDPSCGCGAFLIAGINFILNWLKSEKASIKTLPRLSLQECLDMFEVMIYGVDIDETAIRWARRLLLLSIWHFFIKNDVSEKDIKRLRIPTFEKNLICSDFLESHSLGGTFDIIVGGPPFVRIQELYNNNPERIGSYRKRFRTAEKGQFDLYMVFLEKSIELLRDKGYLSVSVSNTFLRSQTGSTLRKLIAEKCTIEEIVEFEDSKLYPNALVQIAAITLRKTTGKNITRHIFVKGNGFLYRKLSKINQQNKNSFLQIRRLPVSACHSDNWILKSEGEMILMKKIESKGVPLAELSNLIRFGSATGADDVFVLKYAKHIDPNIVLAKSRCTGQEHEFESGILRPILRGRHIKQYIVPKSETLCIFPYDKTGCLITEDVILRNFPRTYEYFKSCQIYLNSRKLKQEQPWYAFREQDVSEIIKGPKIIGSVVNTGNGFTIDQHGLFCNNSVIMICPNENAVHPFYLLAVLNSMVFKIWAQYRMPTLGSNWYSYRVRILREYPMVIPKNNIINEVANMAKKIINGEGGEIGRLKFQSLIDKILFEHYCITSLI
jgi:type I restriction-modification system DNA methylase subunit